MPRNSTVVIIPTYNEKDNIAHLIGEIENLNLPLDILVVDDNSPDGTARVVESLKIKWPNINIVCRNKKDGLGPAYIEAFSYVLDKQQYDCIIHMDGDFSHDPKTIPTFMDIVKECDVVVGSRYVKGGKVSDRWSISRKILSRLGNSYARFVTGLRLRDCTSGFRCYRTRVLKEINFNKKFLNGYGFLVQMLYEVNKANAKICEIPIFFNERTKGTSKMNVEIMLEAFFSLLLLRIRSLFF